MKSIFLLLFSVISLSISCPSECRCKEDSVDCSNSGLRHFPHSIPSHTTTLNLSSNSIEKIIKEDLQSLSSLESLILSHNSIKHIEENLLDVAPQLLRLSLSSNLLRHLPPLASRKTSLISLELQHNHLRNIDAEAFTSLSDLIQLDIAHNRLQTVPTTLFEANEKLTVLKMHANHWNCDCRLRSLVAVLRHTEDEAQLAECHFPDKLKQKSLLGLSGSSFKCFDPIVDVDGTHDKVKLECPGHNGRSVDVQWMYKSKEIEFSSANFEILEDGTLLLDSNEPLVDYECARNVQRHHRKTRQLSKNEPQFTFKSSDASYREGSSIKLHCEVTGTPFPKIQWFFRSSPLHHSPKHYMTEKNQVLRIYPLLDQDEGGYTCVVTNAHGAIEHTAQVQLISSVPPSIYEGPHSQTVNVGATVQFSCRAHGTPKAEITWSFDGSVIAHIRGRLSASNDGTVLTISNVAKEDGGVYSCMAGNVVGAMSADAKLTVQSDLDNRINSLLDEETLESIASTARSNVNRALNTSSGQSLGHARITTPTEFKRLFHFSLPNKVVELSKAREIYEESVRLAHEHVLRGLRLPVDQLHPNVTYEAVLSSTHVDALMALSGCQSGKVTKNPCTDTCFHSMYRSFDGQCNNREHPMWGASEMPLHRLMPPIYENGFNTPVGWERGRLYRGFPMPNAREVSQQLVATQHITPHDKLSAMVMQWGQFVDHDLTHTATPVSRKAFANGAFCNRTCENLDPCFNIQLPANDPKRRNNHHMKYPCIEFERSGAVCGSGETSVIFEKVTYREQLNILTSYVDASSVYGSTETQALELRDLYGENGKLRYDIVSGAQKPMLPFEKDSNMDCRRNFSLSNPIRCFLAGDLRANEQLGLTAMHTIFLREHNRIADKLLSINAEWSGETVFQESRKLVGAFHQHITYKHWLPIVLGKDNVERLLGTYNGYRPDVNPSISNAFATAAFRFGHTLINPKLFRLNANFETIKEGDIDLHKAMFAPEFLLSDGGVDPLIRGLFASPMKMPMSTQLLNMELTEKLFHRFHEVALDLASMNIQRSRDHGLPFYAEYRRFCNLSVPETWNDMSHYVPDIIVRNKLKQLYGHPGNIDLWVGGVVENKLHGALVGPTFACLIADQFKRLRDGDRFWYENEGVFTSGQLMQIKKVSLARIFCDNGDTIDRVQENVFQFPGARLDNYGKCANVQEVDLIAWKDAGKQQCSIDKDNLLNDRLRGTGKHCTSRGERKRNGDIWNLRGDPCTVCKCDNGKVWCNVKDDC